MAGFSYAQIIKGRPYPIGSRAVIRMGKDRFLIYLPVTLNYLWKELHERKVKVRVYIEVPEDQE
jgi:hypothetical protein